MGLRSDERGAQLVEYLMLVGLIALVALGGFYAFSSQAKTKVEGQASCVASLDCAASPGAGETLPASAEAAPPGSGGDGATTGASQQASSGGKPLWRRAFDVGKGFVLGAWDTVKGLANIVLHPIDTVKGLWHAVTHPIQTGKAIKDAIVNAWNENPEELIGRGIFEVVTAPFVVGKASKLKAASALKNISEGSKVAKAANVVDDAADAARLARKGDGIFDATRRGISDGVGGFCFVAGTMVATESGLRPIESIAVGDLVVARDEKSGETGLRRVAHTFVRHQRPVLSVQLSGPDGKVETIGVTPEHPFFVASRGWVDAGELGLGTEVQALDGRTLEVRAMTALSDVATVYNFEVAEAHTYFVGQTGAWVHNDCRAGLKGLRTQQLTDAVKNGKFPKDMSAKELAEVQANALKTTERLFTNQYGDDVALLDAVRGKKGWFDDAAKNVDDSLLKGRPVAKQQADALKVLVNTFKGTDAGDLAVRSAALEKLGKMGKASDIEAILPIVRRPPHSADLYNGLESIKSIMGRAGSPQLRGAKHLADETRTLLGKSQLSDAQRASVIEDVMRHGEIASVKKHVGGNMNEVYFVTYKDSIALADGTRAPIKAVFKPENTYVGKEKPFFTREVSAYEFDRDFAKTGTVPPTVEGMLSSSQVPGSVKPHGVGSLQYMIPNAEPLGKDAVHLNPKFKPFLDSAEGQKQMGEIKTLLYTLNDPDKLPNPGGFKTPNYGNIMAVPDAANPGKYKLFMIDNGGGQGALGRQVTSDILPNSPGKAAENLGKVSASDVEKELSPLIGDADALDVANRVRTARRKPRRRSEGPRRRRPARRRAASRVTVRKPHL